MGSSSLSNEELALKKELLEMLPMKLPLDHPDVRSWLEKAVNVMGKNDLKAGQRWVFDVDLDKMVIVNLN